MFSKNGVCICLLGVGIQSTETTLALVAVVCQSLFIGLYLCVSVTSSRIHGKIIINILFISWRLSNIINFHCI